MSSFRDAKIREDFIARCNELHINAKEKEVKLASLPTNGKHPGHYRAPTESSFERQLEYIAPENQNVSRSFSRRKQAPSIFDSCHLQFYVGMESATSSSFATMGSFMKPKSANSKTSAAARKQAFAKCYLELAACYKKLAALHISEAEEDTLQEADVANGAQVYPNEGMLQREVPMSLS